jgi:hypothetical protein
MSLYYLLLTKQSAKSPSGPRLQRLFCGLPFALPGAKEKGYRAPLLELSLSPGIVSCDPPQHPSHASPTAAPRGKDGALPTSLSISAKRGAHVLPLSLTSPRRLAGGHLAAGFDRPIWVQSPKNRKKFHMKETVKNQNLASKYFCVETKRSIHMQYKIEASNENSVSLTVTDSDKKWRMSVTRDNTESLSVNICGDGVTQEDVEWLLRELALLLPPDFVDQEEHEEALFNAH